MINKFLYWLGFEKKIIWSGNRFLPKCKSKPNKYRNFTYRVTLRYVSRYEKWAIANYGSVFNYEQYILNLAITNGVSFALENMKKP